MSDTPTEFLRRPTFSWIDVAIISALTPVVRALLFGWWWH